MFRLQQLSLVQFKNYEKGEFRFGESVVAICGKNGIGKTNLLDAIHYLCFTRSYFSRADAQSVRQGQAGFRLEGDFRIGERTEKAVCVLRETGKKEFGVDGQLYEKFSHHIGRYPCVVIAPDDATLVTGDSRERRNFLDALLSQLDAEYLQQLIRYRKVLEQRNSLLKSFADSRQLNYSLLDVLDGQLTAPCREIFRKRKEFLSGFFPMAQHWYQSIARQPEPIGLQYESDLLQADMAEWLSVNRQKDLQLQRTSAGVHRDELVLKLGSQLFKLTGSQGQRKSLLFALKLAELESLAQAKGFPPLLLLDDVFEKLDEDRISNLLEKVCVDNKGQVFITDTNEERLTSHLQSHGISYQLIRL